MLSPDGMYVSFPKDKIDVGGIKTSSVGGHGIVIAVDESGNTRGSTYGRDILVSLELLEEYLYLTFIPQRLGIQQKKN